MSEKNSSPDRKPRAGRELTQHIDVLIGRRLKEIRDIRDWSQSEVAAGLGISTERVGQMENGQRMPASRLWQFCGLFGIEAADVFRGLPQTLGPMEAAGRRGVSDVGITTAFVADGPDLQADVAAASRDVPSSRISSEISQAASALSGLEQQVLLRLLNDVRARRK